MNEESLLELEKENDRLSERVDRLYDVSAALARVVSAHGVRCAFVLRGTLCDCAEGAALAGWRALE